MGTEVLLPQDCLIDRIMVSPAVFQHHRRENFGNGNGNGNVNPRVAPRKPVVRPEQKKKNGKSQPLMTPRRAASLDDLRKNHQIPNGSLVMGQVTILRRGESLDSKTNGGRRQQTAREKKTADGDVVVCGTERLGPDPEQIRIRDVKSLLLSPPTVSPVGVAGERRDVVYAGSAVSLSPSPRALPLPSFFSKKKYVDDNATKDLRRLLRLD